MTLTFHDDKAETWSAMRVHSIKGTVLLGETKKYDINVPFSLVSVHKLRATTLPYLNLCTDILGVY
jgi:hypothetical protein